MEEAEGGKPIAGWAKKRLEEMAGQERYEALRNELKAEDKLRKQHPSLNEAWEKYQVLLTLIKG